VVGLEWYLFCRLKQCFDPHTVNIIQGDSLARGPKLLSMYTVEQRGFLFRKYWQTGSFNPLNAKLNPICHLLPLLGAHNILHVSRIRGKACQTAFRKEFGERRAPSKCCIQKLVQNLETRGSRSNACRLLSLGPIEG